MSNVNTVQAIYEAFGRGDIPSILDKIADQVDWEYGFRDSPNPVPWLQPRKGKSGVTEFFQSLESLEIQRFVPKAILEGSGLVVALVDFEARVKHTGKCIAETDEVHLWHFNLEGKVVRFRHCVDTYQHMLAYQA